MRVLAALLTRVGLVIVCTGASERWQSSPRYHMMWYGSAAMDKAACKRNLRSVRKARARNADDQ